MSMDAQGLEAAFEPVDAETPAEQAAPESEPEAAGQDFNTFFERLNALEGLTWRSDEDEDEEPAPLEEPVPPPPAQARPAPQAAAPPRKTTQPRRQPAGAVQPGKGASVLRTLKFAAVGLALFTVGLGAGWAALSLPGRFMERAGPAVTPAPTTSVAAADNTEASDTPAITAPLPAADKAPRDVQATAQAGPAAEPQATASTADTAGQPSAAALPPAPGVDAVEAPAATAATPSGDTQARANAAASAQPAGGGYALQVGACSSHDCVQTYRELLLQVVKASAVQVEQQPKPGGEGILQRVRVAPLSRAEAERLKAKLTQTDPRLGNAYVLTIR